LNCDIVGLSGVEAEAEIISLAHEIMRAFGADEKYFSIRINSREALAGVDKALLREWDKKGKPEGIKISITPAIEKLLAGLNAKGVTNAVFDPNIVRGFDYYTGMVFEVFDTSTENRRSLFGGGRYDNLLEIFGVEPVPCVGFGMGDITIRDFLETHKLPLA
jgi:histidyl-tRNA synthetase